MSDCSDGSLRAGSISLIAGDSLDLPAGDRPRVLLRCEQGRVDAYLVLGDAEQEAETLADSAVRIELDSAPDCSSTAP